MLQEPKKSAKHDKRRKNLTSILVKRFVNSLPKAPTPIELRQGSKGLGDHVRRHTIRRTNETTITLRIDEKLHRGSLDSLRQICCEIVNPGKRQQPDPACPLLANGVPIGFEQSAILVQAIDSGCAPLVGVVWEQGQRWD